jgi:hypothetical protein
MVDEVLGEVIDDEVEVIDDEVEVIDDEVEVIVLKKKPSMDLLLIQVLKIQKNQNYKSQI